MQNSNNVFSAHKFYNYSMKVNGILLYTTSADTLTCSRCNSQYVDEPIILCRQLYLLLYSGTCLLWYVSLYCTNLRAAILWIIYHMFNNCIGIIYNTL